MRDAVYFCNMATVVFLFPPAHFLSIICVILTLCL